MFDKNFEDRLITWAKFREELETHPEPFQAVIDYYNRAPISSIYNDPWDNSTWPDPWQMIEENRYCEFGIVLGMCYSLQLTERFINSTFEIHIYTDIEKSGLDYVLIVDNTHVLGYDRYKVVQKSDLPDTLQPQQTYLMPNIH